MFRLLIPCLSLMSVSVLLSCTSYHHVSRTDSGKYLVTYGKQFGTGGVLQCDLGSNRLRCVDVEITESKHFSSSVSDSKREDRQHRRHDGGNRNANRTHASKSVSQECSSGCLKYVMDSEDLGITDELRNDLLKKCTVSCNRNAEFRFCLSSTVEGHFKKCSTLQD